MEEPAAGARMGLPAPLIRVGRLVGYGLARCAASSPFSFTMTNGMAAR